MLIAIVVIFKIFTIWKYFSFDNSQLSWWKFLILIIAWIPTVQVDFFIWNLIIFNWWGKSIWNIWSLPIGQVKIIDNILSYPIVCQVKIFDYIWSYTIGHVNIFDNAWSYPTVCQVQIPIFGFPAGRLFQPHGFDISNRWIWKFHRI